MRKSSISLYIPVDLAAVCSVAFIILMLYLSMAKPKIQEPVKINMPETSDYRCTMAGLGDAMVLMGEGKVFLSIPDTVRKGVFKRVAALQKITSNTVQTASLKQSDFIEIRPNGISTNNGFHADLNSIALADWIKIAGEEYKKIYNRPMRISIKADKATPYADFKKVIAILQDQGINKMLFITATRNSIND